MGFDETEFRKLAKETHDKIIQLGTHHGYLMDKYDELTDADYVRQSAGYQLSCAICRRTYGKETKAHTDNSHLPIYNANWGFPKRKCLKMAMIEESEYSARERSTHSSPRTATPFTWRRGTVIVY